MRNHAASTCLTLRNCKQLFFFLAGKAPLVVVASDDGVCLYNTEPLFPLEETPLRNFQGPKADALHILYDPM